VAGEREVATGTATLVPDTDGRRGWTLYINGMESSHVDLDDPTRLDFEYMRWLTALLESVPSTPAGPGAHPDLRVLHLGGGGCTMAQYLRAVRPGARQLVVEVDPAVLDLARQAFGLRNESRLRLRVGEARQVVSAQPDGSWDVVVRDAFSGSEVPPHLRTRQFVEQVARVLAPGGVYAANLADGELLTAARREAATLLTVFEHVALVAEPAQLRGRRYGNVLVAGSDAPLPWASWTRRLAGDPVRARLLETDEVARLASGRSPFEDPAAAPPDAEPPAIPSARGGPTL
jgi:SAM-dependent methyltransferase